MRTHKNHKPSCKVWIEYKGTPVLGKGGAEILKAIAKEQSISKAAEKLSKPGLLRSPVFSPAGVGNAKFFYAIV